MKRMMVVLALVAALVLSGVAPVAAGHGHCHGKCQGQRYGGSGSVVTLSGPMLPGGSWNME